MEVTENYGFLLGNVWKYLWRANEKHESPLEDIKKARWYLNRYSENFAKDFPLDYPKDSIKLADIVEHYPYNIGKVMMIIGKKPHKEVEIIKAVYLLDREIDRLEKLTNPPMHIPNNYGHLYYQPNTPIQIRVSDDTKIDTTNISLINGKTYHSRAKEL